MGTWLVQKGADNRPVGLIVDGRVRTDDADLLQAVASPQRVSGRVVEREGEEVCVTSVELAGPGDPDWEAVLVDTVDRAGMQAESAGRMASSLLVMPLDAGSVGEFPELLAMPLAPLPSS